MEHFSLFHTLGFTVFFTLVFFIVGCWLVKIIQAPVKKQRDEAMHVAVTWWFLPELSNLENGISELEDPISDPIKKEARDNFLKKIKDIREMDIGSKTIDELKKVMKELRDIRYEVRCG